MRTYRVFNYTTVKKNSEGAWAVSNMDKTDMTVQIDDDSSPKDVCQKLRNLGVLQSANMRTLKVSDLSKSIIEVKAKKDSQPLCRLQLTTF